VTASQHEGVSNAAAEVTHESAIRHHRRTMSRAGSTTTLPNHGSRFDLGQKEEPSADIDVGVSSAKRLTGAAR
jgi:hypothetical protein